MAKRKRLSPAQSGFLSGPADPVAPSSVGMRAPIAHVAGDSAASAALEEIAQTLTRARDEGRMAVSLPLGQVVADHLVRDRVALDPEALEGLKQSLLSRGQQMPIEVVALPAAEDGQPRYGLISGWRRLRALHALLEETGQTRFAEVAAFLRRPDDLAQSYVAMVEENEIRADLSHYERARIVLRAVETGAFETEKQALQSLFAGASYARRSKIKTFVPIVAALDGHLRFPAALNERNGLLIGRALAAVPDMAGRMRAALAGAEPATALEEADLLKRVMQDRSGRKPAAGAAEAPRPMPPPRRLAEGLYASVRPGRIELTGDAADEALLARLEAVLNAGG